MNLEQLIEGFPLETDPKKAQEEIIKAGNAMKSLVNYEPFKVYRTYLMRRQRVLAAEVMKTLPSDGAIYLQESQKGAIQALAWAHDVPSIIIEQSKELLDAQQARIAGKKEKA